jgi:chromate transporter
VAAPARTNTLRETKASRLTEIARLFVRLGATAFGGPAAHVAMMEDEVVRRRGWLTRAEFLDYLGATNLIPGPNSTEMAIYIGRARGGWPGLVIAGASFIAPAALIVAAIAWAYVVYGKLPQAAALLYGIKPIVIAIVAQALWGLARTAVKTARLAAIGLGAVGAVLAGVDELLTLAMCGLAAVSVASFTKRHTAAVIVGGGAAFKSSLAAATATLETASSFGLWPLFLTFAKIGAVLFGSGYVLLAFLHADFVDRLHWLTEQQLLDAIAIGQVTPGPLFTTATFIGYLLDGPRGALIATLGIFLPAFTFVALSGPIVPRLRRSAAASAVLDGINVGSLALMAVVSWQLGRQAIIDPLTLALCLLGAVALLWYRANSVWLIAAGGIIGWLTSF